MANYPSAVENNEDQNELLGHTNTMFTIGIISKNQI